MFRPRGPAGRHLDRGGSVIIQLACGDADHATRPSLRDGIDDFCFLVRPTLAFPPGKRFVVPTPASKPVLLALGRHSPRAILGRVFNAWNAW